MRRVFTSLAVPIVLILVILYFAHPPILKELARFLFVEDPLEPGSAIIVLPGFLPFRTVPGRQRSSINRLGFPATG